MKASALARTVLKRATNPRHLWSVVKLQRARGGTQRVRDDAQLQLIARILPGGFLHYGYFDDADRQPEDLSLNEIVRAQLRYAELVTDQIEDRSAPVLDVGCGMGGLIPLLQRRGFSPVALTPDRSQIQYIRRMYPSVPAIHAKLEELNDPEHADHARRYGTIITAESLQYLKLDQAVPMMAALLKSTGRWIVCDYFRVAGRTGAPDVKPNTGGHDWDDFCRRIECAGWKSVHESDITANVLPTLRCVYMCGQRFGLPALQFAVEKLRRRRPGLHYILEEVLGQLTDVLTEHLEVVNPETFATQKKYMLMVMVRRAPEERDL